MDIDTLMEIKNEEKAYQEWLRGKKNRILSMVNEKRKQAEWKKYFPPVTHDDSYLSGNVF